METILSRFYDSAYDSDLWFSQGHKRSYDSAYEPVSGSGSGSGSVASESVASESPHWHKKIAEK